MREILFKAKTTVKENREFNNVWVKGNLILSNNKYYIHPIGNIVRVESELGKVIVMHEVDPYTICQYTGLTDKNGQKIWENDIVSFTHSKITSESLAEELGFPYFEKKEYKRNYAIEFVNTYCTYGLRFRSKSIHFPCKASTLRMHDCVVIGNIFDNPELLNE